MTVKALPPSTENELNPFGVGVFHNCYAFVEGENFKSLLEMPSPRGPRYWGQFSAKEQREIPETNVAKVKNFVLTVISAVEL
jgi:hypothetical protein